LVTKHADHGVLGGGVHPMDPREFDDDEAADQVV
jgi:hypothetical protein